MGIGRTPIWRNMAGRATAGVVLLTGGIWIGIAKPCFACSLGAEGRTTTGAMNRAQQAYFLEHGRFANALEQLQLGIPAQTKRYTYAITTGKNATFQYARVRSDCRTCAFSVNDLNPFAQSCGHGGFCLWYKPCDTTYQSFVGMVYLKDGIPQTKMCAGHGTTALVVRDRNGIPDCPALTQEIK